MSDPTARPVEPPEGGGGGGNWQPPVPIIRLPDDPTPAPQADLMERLLRSLDRAPTPAPTEGDDA